MVAEARLTQLDKIAALPTSSMARGIIQAGAKPLARVGQLWNKAKPVVEGAANLANTGMTGMMMYNMFGGGGGGGGAPGQPQMAMPPQQMMPGSLGGYAMSVLSKQGSDPEEKLERLNKIAAMPLMGMAGRLAGTAGRGLGKALPFVGNALSAGSGIMNAMKGNWGEAGLDFAGMLPVVGNAINLGRTAVDVGSTLAPGKPPVGATPRMPMTGHPMGTGAPFGSPRFSVLNKFSSAELKERALAFEVGMNDFCKAAEFDDEDRAALIELMIKMAADPLPNFGSGVQRNPQGQVTGNTGGWWSNLASGFFDRFSKGLQRWGGQNEDPLHTSGEAAKAGMPPNAKFDAAVQAHDSTNIAGEKTKAFEAARQRMKDFSMTPQEAARDVFRQMGVHGAGWSREFLGQNAGTPAKAPGSPIFSKPPTTQPLAPKPIASPTTPASTPGGGASPFAPSEAAQPKMMTSMDMPNKNFNVPGSGMPPPSAPAAPAAAPAASAAPASSAKPRSANAGIYVPKSMANEYGMQTGERGKVDLSSLGKPGFDS